MPSGSDEAEPLKLTDTGAVPADGVVVKLAVGATLAGGAAETVTVLVVEAVAPWLSVTVSTTVNVPVVVKVWLVVAPVAEAPSPNVQA